MKTIYLRAKIRGGPAENGLYIFQKRLITCGNEETGARCSGSARKLGGPDETSHKGRPRSAAGAAAVSPSRRAAAAVSKGPAFTRFGAPGAASESPVCSISTFATSHFLNVYFRIFLHPDGCVHGVELDITGQYFVPYS